MAGCGAMFRRGGLRLAEDILLGIHVFAASDSGVAAVQSFTRCSSVPFLAVAGPEAYEVMYSKWDIVCRAYACHVGSWTVFMSYCLLEVEVGLKLRGNQYQYIGNICFWAGAKLAVIFCLYRAKFYGRSATVTDTTYLRDWVCTVRCSLWHGLHDRHAHQATRFLRTRARECILTGLRLMRPSLMPLHSSTKISPV